HGEFVMLGMYAALMVVVWIGGGPAIFAIAAAVALAALGVAIYFSLIRHVTRGPMLAQILSTFGLALLLRYTAFWIFSANFVSLPTNALSGTVNLAGIYLPIAQLVAGLVATFYPWSPSVGETFGLIAFVVVALGGFGSVLGSLYAGLIIGLIQSASAFWLGAIYKDIVVYGLFVALLWLRPQGLMGKAW